jgi:pimeloyl-ACP methyl ester carboxylesterase
VSSIQASELRVIGLRTRVLQAGPSDDEEAVVFVHGGPGSADDWSRLLPQAGAFARAVAFDLPGFGNADKPRGWHGYLSVGWATFIAGTLNRLRVRRAHLVANDLGGEAALTWALAHPENFASAVLISTGVLIDYRWHMVARLHRVPLLGHLSVLIGRLGLRPVLRLYEPDLPKDVVDRWQRGYDRGTRRAMLRFYSATPTSAAGPTTAELASLDRPALVIWGADNRFVPVEQAERQRRSFPSAEIAVLAGSRHYPHLDSPQRVNELVLPFLRRQVRVREGMAQRGWARG